MKKNKDLSYYRKMLYSDTIVLLVLAIIFGMAGLFMGGVGVFVKSALFIVFFVILIFNKDENKPFVGVLSIIVGALMLLTSLGDGSLFGVVYFLLSIFYIIHSIIYLVKLKDYGIQSNDSDEVVVKNSKIKYLSLLSVILTMILLVIGIILSISSPFGSLLCKVAILVVNVANIIFCIILHNKKIKSVLVYVMLSISIIITLFSGLFVVDDIGKIVRKNLKYNNEEYIFEMCQNVEKDIERNIVLLDNLTSLKVEIGENSIISFEDYLDLDYVSSLEELKEIGYTCDGYTVLEWKTNPDITSYYDVTRKLSFPYRMNDYFSNVKTYMHCTGKYDYKTSGFDITKLSN